MIAFSGQELGAATTVRLLEDDQGNTVERAIPKAAFRRDVLLYPFDNESGDPDLDWLRISPVGWDLEQDMFVTVVSFEDTRVTEQIQEAGFERNDRLPLSLKRQAAEQRNVGHFLEGGFQGRLSALERGSLLGDPGLIIADQDVFFGDLRFELNAGGARNQEVDQIAEAKSGDGRTGNVYQQ